MNNCLKKVEEPSLTEEHSVSMQAGRKDDTSNIRAQRLKETCDHWSCNLSFPFMAQRVKEKGDIMTTTVSKSQFAATEVRLLKNFECYQ